MNTTYFILSDFNGMRGDYLYLPRKYKGLTSISFNLTALALGNYYPMSVKIDFGDGSPILERTTSFMNITGVFGEIYSHEYNASDSIESYQPIIYVTYSNFRVFTYRMPINIYKASFFTDCKNLEVGTSQFVDVSSNEMFVSFDTANGDVLNLKLK